MKRPFFILCCLPGICCASRAAEDTASATERIVKLVDENRIAEALAETDAQLVKHPDDPELKEIRKNLAENVAATGKPSAPALTGEDRLAIGTALIGVQNAIAIKDPEARRDAFLKVLALDIPGHAEAGPDWIPLWQARAFAALALDDIEAGWNASQKLKKLGALDRADAELGNLLSQLNLKGWFNLDRAGLDRELAARAAVRQNKADWVADWQFAGNRIVSGAGKVVLLRSEKIIPKALRIENPESPRFIVRKLEEDTIPGKYHDQGTAVINEVTKTEWAKDFTTLTVHYTRSVSTVKNHVTGATTSEPRRMEFRLIEENGRRVIRDNLGNLYTNPKTEAVIAERKRREAVVIAERRRLAEAEQARLASRLAADSLRYFEARKTVVVPEPRIELIAVPNPPALPTGASGNLTETFVAQYDHEADRRRFTAYLGKTEVTQAQYRALAGENPSEPKGDDLPVCGVTWDRASAFCEKLTARERAAGRLDAGWRYTLPTVSQWNRVAAEFKNLQSHQFDRHARHAGVPKFEKSFWGGFYFDGYANGNSGLVLRPVATLDASSQGFHDLYGNVREWCLDRLPGDRRYAKGGDYMTVANELQRDDAPMPPGSTALEYRTGEDDYDKRMTIGFRLALVHDDNPETAAAEKAR